MSRLRRPPVFCDNCANMALAELDGAPLCFECLTAAQISAAARGEPLGHVEPLSLIAPQATSSVPAMPTPVKAPSKDDTSDALSS